MQTGRASNVGNGRMRLMPGARNITMVGHEGMAPFCVRQDFSTTADVKVGRF